MTHVFTDPDLIELNRIWPLGQQLVVPEDGTIVVAGAYEGRYCHFLSERFPTARICGYEPQYGSFVVAQKRLANKPLVRIFNVGLGTREQYFELGRAGTDGASVFRLDGETHHAPFVNAVEALSACRMVDLFLVNLEGGEWVLLPHLLNELMHHRIASMAIQFHPEYVCEKHQKRVLDQLGEYYDHVYWDWPSWTYWKRRS